MWHSLILGICVLAAGDDASVADSSLTAKEPTPLHVLSRATSEAMRREALAKESPERTAAILALCDLHRQLQTDERYERVDKLKELRGRVYSRLRRVQADLKRSADRNSSTASKTVDGQALLEQQAQDELALAAADSLAAGLQRMDAAIGGPNHLVGHGGRAMADHGEALVDLIERTINPAFWDTNGGPGAIVYYQPLQCLVVRASAEVHHRLGGLVGDLRDAGR